MKISPAQRKVLEAARDGKLYRKSSVGVGSSYYGPRKVSQRTVFALEDRQLIGRGRAEHIGIGLTKTPYFITAAGRKALGNPVA